MMATPSPDEGDGDVAENMDTAVELAKIKPSVSSTAGEKPERGGRTTTYELDVVLGMESEAVRPTSQRERRRESAEMFSEDLASHTADGPWIPGIPGLEWLDLSAATIIAGVLGVIIGILISVFSNPNSWVTTFLNYPGKLWVQALKLLVLPLICSLMILVPSSLRQSTGELGRMGELAVKYYVLTSTVAACEGIFWVNVIQPGRAGSLDKEDLESNKYDVDGELEETHWYDSVLQIGENAVPPNIVQAAADFNMLGVITVFLIVGLVLNRIREENGGQSPYRYGAIVIKEVAKTTLRIASYVMLWVIWFTPIGMFFLVMAKCASTKHLIKLVKALGMYVVTGTIGQFVHMFFFYPAMYYFVTRNFDGNGYQHFWKIKKAPMVAFATSSSAAALSVSLRSADQGGCNTDVKNFVIPLGSTVNMDGTSLGFPIMVMFIAQLYGKSLGFGSQLSVGILSIICSIGTAPIPNVGMVYVVMLLEAVGSGLDSDEAIETAVATLFLLDWFVDRIETAQNVNSDQFIAKFITFKLKDSFRSRVAS